MNGIASDLHQQATNHTTSTNNNQYNQTNQIIIPYRNPIFVSSASSSSLSNNNLDKQKNYAGNYTNATLFADLTKRLNFCTLSGQHEHSSSSLFDYLLEPNKIDQLLNATRTLFAGRGGLNSEAATNETSNMELESDSTATIPTSEKQQALVLSLQSAPIITQAQLPIDSAGSKISELLITSKSSKSSSSTSHNLDESSSSSSLSSKKKVTSSEGMSYASVIDKSSSSYHSESYEHDSYDDSSDDDDYDDDHDDYYDDHHGHRGKKKVSGKKGKKKHGSGGKKNKKVVYKVKLGKKKKKPKVVYGKAYYPSKKKNHHHRQHKNKKKVTYAYVYEEPDVHYATKYQYYDDHGKYHHPKSHHHHLGGGKSGGGKGRISVAGLFGYTLLCVNYLMMLKEQPHYGGGKGGKHYYSSGKHDEAHDIHHAASGHSHYHHTSKHHHGHGSDHYLSHKNKGGPILLAHCFEIDSRYEEADFLLRKERAKRDLDQIIESVEAAQQAISATNRAGQQPIDNSNSNNSTSSSTTNSTTSLINSDNKLIKQASNQLLSPSLQSYLGQIVWQQNQQRQAQANTRVIETDGQSEVFILGTGSGRGTGGVINADLDSDTIIVDNNSGRGSGNVVGAGAILPNRARLLANNAAVALARNAQLQLIGPVDDTPELVGRRDNLLTSRSRSVDVSLRVTSRSRFAMAPLQGEHEIEQPGSGVGFITIGGQPISTTTGTTSAARLRNSNIEIESSSDGMQADQPQLPGTNGGVVLDLPEYVLSGDSIELTCNHRMPLDRIYSVKWFKDSLEFYRFIPGNGPRPKSFLPLAELRLDLARSNSESLSLRNVSHLSSGLYRCEVVSALPNSGPQLALLDRAELLLPALPDPVPLNNDPIGLVINGQANNVRVSQTAGGGATNAAANLLNLRLNGNGNENLVMQQQNLAQLQQPLQQENLHRAQLVNGPLVRCQSARSYPVAQLRVSINGRELNPMRLLENSTLSYSDFTESNLITFRLALNDFQQAPLERAASLKMNPPSTSSSPSGSPAQATRNSTIESQPLVNNNNRPGTNSNAFGSPAPRIQQPTSAGPNKNQKQQTYANALVQFNDKNVGMTKDDFGTNSKSMLAQNQQQQQKQQQNAKLRTGNQQHQPDRMSSGKQPGSAAGTKPRGSSGNSQNRGQNNRPLFSQGPQAAETSSDRRESDKVLISTEAAAAKAASDALAAPETESGVDVGIENNSQNPSVNNKHHDTNTASVHPQATNYLARGADQTKSDLKQQTATLPTTTSSSKLIRRALRRLPHDSDDLAELDAEIGANEDETYATSASTTSGTGSKLSIEATNSNLSSQEQRIRTTTSRTNNDELDTTTNPQQQPISYSNYIRIKCTSLVGQVRYEMSSELSVPLSVLAGQVIGPQVGNGSPLSTLLSDRFVAANEQHGITVPNRTSAPNAKFASQTDRVAQASHFQAPTHQAPPPTTTQMAAKFAASNAQAREGHGAGAGVTSAAGTKSWLQSRNGAPQPETQLHHAPFVNSNSSTTTGANHNWPTSSSSSGNNKLKSSRGFQIGSSTSPSSNQASGSNRLHQASNLIKSDKQQQAKSGFDGFWYTFSTSLRYQERIASRSYAAYKNSNGVDSRYNGLYPIYRFTEI